MDFLEIIKDKKINPSWLEVDRIKVESVDDIYKGTGKILQASQEWEHEFQELCRLLNIEFKDDYSFLTLGKMNRKLLEAKIITEDEYNKLDAVIEVRNEFVHKYFLDSFFFGDWSYPFDKVSETLTKVLFLIHESNDWISNKIDNGHRPNILD